MIKCIFIGSESIKEYRSLKGGKRVEIWKRREGAFEELAKPSLTRTVLFIIVGKMEHYALCNSPHSIS